MSDNQKSIRRELSHERILNAAARSMRQNGYAGVGVAEVMKLAGMTHGGFYAHFKSRDALLVAALEHAGAESAVAMGRRIGCFRARGDSAVRALVMAYLDEQYLHALDRGCPVVALGSEMVRQQGELLDVSRQRIKGLIQLVQSALPQNAPKERAFALTSSLVGAALLARALGDEAEQFLQATRDALIEQYDHAD